MSPLTDLLNRCPLVDVIDISPRKGTITLDISGRIDLPVTQRMGLVPYLPELLSALKQDQQALHLAQDKPGSIHADFNYGPVSGDMAFTVIGSASTAVLYFNRHAKDRPHPHWFGSVSRFDSHGDEWSHVLDPLVMDDFGTLVPMEGGAQ